jgi:trehalose 6-phosphate synthase
MRANTQRVADLVIASNRGPVEFYVDADGALAARRGAGGLVAVLGPALVTHGGTWVAAAITDGDRAAARSAEGRGRLRQVELPQGKVRLRSLAVDPERYEAYYGRISTRMLWFLHHHLFDLARSPSFDAAFREDWRAYEEVNALFAAACAEETAPGARVLLQDYHLAVAPAVLRARRPDLAIAHFTGCCWADPGYFATLPEAVRRRLIDGMLGADLLAFLVPRWARNFLRCCADLGHEVDETAGSVRARDGRAVAVRTFPVGVDAADLRGRARRADVQAERRSLARLFADRKPVVRVDRMEPSKNVLRGLAGYELFLEQNPDVHGRVVHYVLAYASRSDLPEYRRYAADVREKVAAIKARFGSPDWDPILLETQNNFARGLAAMTLADVLVVNPVRDGMNLVCKEGPVVSDRDAVLILSRKAGAADDLAEGAILVDPFDTVELAEAIAAALAMPAEERARLAGLLRSGATALPPQEWLRAILRELDEARGRR